MYDFDVEMMENQNVHMEDEEGGDEEILREMEKIEEEIERRQRMIKEKKERLKVLHDLRLENEILQERIRFAMEEMGVSIHRRRCVW